MAPSFKDKPWGDRYAAGGMGETVASQLCNVCGEDKPLDRYYRRAKSLDGRQYACKDCQDARQKARTYLRVRDYKLRQTFGITLAQYEWLANQQDGRCAICGTDEPGGRGVLHVDHDHATGAIRGLLCHGCNTGMGGLRDSPALLRRAADYLEAGKIIEFF